MTKPVVSLLAAHAYDVGVLTALILRHFEHLDFHTIAPDAHVVLKPNLIMRCSPSRTATTHPAVVEATILALQQLGAKHITIADSPGGPYTAPLLSGCYQQTGMQEVAARTGAVCNTDLTSAEQRRAENKLCHGFEIITPIRKADLIINLCKVKTHCMMSFSCGVKNLFGCIPGLLKPQLHYRFPEEDQFARMLVDLAETVRPVLTIVDGIDGMEGDGPTAGTPRHLGVIAAARMDSIYALDLLLARMIGFDPSNVSTIQESIKQRLCPADWRDITLRGDAPLAEQITPFVIPASRSLDFSGNIPAFFAPMVRALRPVLVTRPVVRKRDCIGCGKCAETCPADTIALENKKAFIHPDKCIRCFCCHELCPVKAIDVKTPWIFSVLHRKTTP